MWRTWNIKNFMTRYYSNELLNRYHNTSRLAQYAQWQTVKHTCDVRYLPNGDFSISDFCMLSTPPGYISSWLDQDWALIENCYQYYGEALSIDHDSTWHEVLESLDVLEANIDRGHAGPSCGNLSFIAVLSGQGCLLQRIKLVYRFGVGSQME